MHDLVGAYERMNKIYQWYIESAFPLRYESLSEERKKLLAREGILSQPPILETIPVYPSSGMSLLDVCQREEMQNGYENLYHLAKALFPDDRKLYRHQWNSLLSVLGGSDIVVTTGTGSGKTECFLLPLLAELSKELSSWPDCPKSPPDHKWWNSEIPDWKSQWGHTGRNQEGLHAVRGLILYPLNALVEDQMRRLRSTLDSDYVHRWLDDGHGRNRILFGRYTGQTPVSGEKSNSNAVKRLHAQLHEMEETSREMRQQPDLDEEMLYHFPNIDGGEMWSRWDMQVTPPDILITNYSMLNIMLMRDIESNIFKQTRDWLEGDSTRKFFLIIDELHSYRGTPGTEVGYILRLLIDRIGLDPNSDQLAILATSASVTEDEKSDKFLQEFFGRDASRFKRISEEQELPEATTYINMRDYQQNFKNFADSIQSNPFDPMSQPDPGLSDNQTAMQTLAIALGQQPSSKDSRFVLLEALKSLNVHQALRDACREVSTNKVVRPAKVPVLDDKLFPGARTEGRTASKAMRGMLLALGMSQDPDTDQSLQPVRGHVFFHNLQNLWVCSNPNCNETHTHRVSEAEQNIPVGALHAIHRLACKCGGRVLDLIVCEVCGDVFLGGFRSGQSGKLEILTSDQPDLENMPDRVSVRHISGQYVIFWPLKEEHPWTTVPQDEEYTIKSKIKSKNGRRITRRWVRAKLNVFSGQLKQNASPLEENEMAGWVHVVAGRNPDEPAMPHKCPRCDADYRKRKRFPTPLRNHRTGFQKACQVIASALSREIPESAQKLVIFSDSRQDAAKLAGGMERDHFRDMVRVAMLSAHKTYRDEFVAFIRATLSMKVDTQPALDRIMEMNKDLHAEISKPMRAEDMSMRNRYAQWNPYLTVEIGNFLDGVPTAIPQARKELLRIINDFPNRIPLQKVQQAVWNILLSLGICPGGTNYWALNFRRSQSEIVPWWECFDWSAEEPQPIHADDAVRNHIIRMQDYLASELMYALFPHVARTLEGLGQGWVTYHQSENSTPLVIQATDAAIRELGRRRRYLGADYFNEGTSKTLPGYITNYLGEIGVDYAAIEHQLNEAGVAAGGEYYVGLNPKELYLMQPPFDPRDEREGWRCPTCNAFYLHPAGGKCPTCIGTSLEKGSTAEASFDYYRYLSQLSGDPFRFNCQELTGQSDTSERPLRQRRFQEIFFGDEVDKKQIHGIDLLSVTTTMEAGVDIGALSAVMMSNMPPRRFNYQQRVGRAGRRGTGVSFAITFCRGRSHDDYYYHRTEKMTGDPPPTPYVDMEREPIFCRVFFKEILRRAFEEANFPIDTLSEIDDEVEERFLESVHGQFGPVRQWHHIKPYIQDWLDKPETEHIINEILDTLRFETGWSGNSSIALDFCNKMSEFVKTELLDQITKIVEDPQFTQDALSERLANAGLLPMFGFPTRVRLLYTNWPYSGYPWPPEKGLVDRDIDIAISQFAPGSETVKDKAVHTACGVVELYPAGDQVGSRPGFAPPLEEENPAWIGLCEHCQAVVPLKTEDVPNNNVEIPLPIDCYVCGKTELRSIDAREPKGFFTDQQPTDFDGAFEWNPRATRPTLSFEVQPENTEHVKNTDVSILENKEILSINDDGGSNGFVFQAARIRGRQWQDAYAVSPQNNQHVSVFGQPSRIALLSRRRTDILLVGMTEWLQGIFANPTEVEGRAAWYSLAFYLQTAAAAILDIDTTELDGGFRATKENDLTVGQAFLSDKLENGAGYCRWFGNPEHFQLLLDQAKPDKSESLAELWMKETHHHIHECDTSCNTCLRDFHNLPYHGLLDWRLALDMARLAASSTVSIDLVSQWDKYENPWSVLLQGDNAPVPATMRRLRYDLKNFGELRGYVKQGGTVKKMKKIWIECHPLWTKDHPSYIAAAEEAKIDNPGYKVDMMNPFKALRRPADYV